MFLFLFVNLMSCSTVSSDEESQNPVVMSQDSDREIASKMFGKISSILPDTSNDTSEKIALGRLLYSEKKLSVNQTQSCESCHQLDNWGVDGLRVSKGALGKEVERNSPSTFNAWGHVAQFWDGRAPTLEEQAKGPILAAGEMGMPSPEAVVEVLSSDSRYVEAFDGVFEDGLTFDNVANAIAAFERTLVTEDRFDDWLSGDVELSEKELRGFRAFTAVGCNGCHSGPLMGGQSFQKLGIVGSYRPAGDDTHVDLGRYNITNKVTDQEVFKVPSLRNVAQTGPWFHDGRIETLEDAIRLMSRIQLGRELTEEQVSSLVAFLNVLNDKQ
jgi:cytochrome c peroxidase